MKKAIYLLIASILILHGCTNQDLDDNKLAVDEIVQKDSELFEQLKKVAASEPGDGDLIIDDQISCISFVYPIGIYTVDSQGIAINLTALYSNQGLSDFLDSLSPTDEISISYPIESNLSNGTALNITNNEELKESIDTCIEEQKEEIVSACNGIFAAGEVCYWKVGYTFEGSNDFLGAELDGRGVTSLEYGTLNTTGTWNALFIEDDLFINLNFLNAGAAGDYLNKNWKVIEYNQELFVLENENDELILNRYCTSDGDDCFNLTFEECELDATPGVAEFVLGDYTSCILEILRYDEDDYEVSYFLSAADSQNEVNPLDDQSVYNNTLPEEEIFVNVLNLESNEIERLSIALIANDCE
ncbi:hypothetical protein BST97_06615 [Nonlabens spongiae]|uniref:Uncharacterized protein n=1 Tax=Nonlabens spongiae TaxID=331648 RepID=A0A1W6MJA9_9FLAO|nr:hypothetical protein [Nonlabens spongiae]ARN77695.1 hypothetical protein BST97_06615 [Nonlabens spongiae]